ncbi:MAG: histone deacetylase [Spirochaetales bacterium]|nr:histone deacetylase [Spirochaetales bacterium]
MRTGYVYDDIFLKHDLPGHPENPGRLRAIMEYLEERGLLSRMVKAAARPASEDELCTCHHPSLVRLVRELCSEGYGQIDEDTYVNQYSYEAASMAAGGMIDLTRSILAGDLSNGIVLARPPGHHATTYRSMGFCLFNTVAIGMKAALKDPSCKKAAVVDIDVHHGNGTQEIFYKNPAALYVSIHQYPHYPGTGALLERGEGEAEGTTVNIPFPPFAGDHAYTGAFTKIVLPVLDRFRPDFIFISVGFDAHRADRLSETGLGLRTYHWMCGSLAAAAKKLCSGRIVFCLEGGYNPGVLAAGTGNIVRSLIGESSFDDLSFDDTSFGEAEPECDVTAVLKSVEHLHNLC